MPRLEDLQLFARSAALGSFSAAAREANLLAGQVSAAIKRLEGELQVRLFARSTRSLRLTNEGEQYLPYAQNALATLIEGREQLRREGAPVQGTLQLAMPSDLGRNLLLPWLMDFRRQHPALSLRLFLSDQVSDVFRDPVDVAIRYGRLQEASVVALPLAPHNRRVLVASPAYLARAGRPGAPAELTRHACLRYLLGGRVHERWSFVQAGQHRVVDVTGPLLSDDADVVRRCAVAGEGIAYKSWLDVCADVGAGRLEVLLPELQGEATPLHLVCPHRRQFSPAVRLLQAALQAQCARMPLPPAGTQAALPD